MRHIIDKNFFQKLLRGGSFHIHFLKTCYIGVFGYGESISAVYQAEKFSEIGQKRVFLQMAAGGHLEIQRFKIKK